MSKDYNPFQSPEAVSQLRSGEAWPIVPFQSGHQRAMITIWLLAILAIIYVAGIAVAGTQYASLELQPNGTYAFSREGALLERARAMLAVVDLLVVVGLAVAFSMWTHRASRNLPALGGRGLKYTPGWAVGWFFVPLANLVMPYLVGAEIWRESDPEQKHLDGRGGKTTSPLVICWWLSYITRSVPSLVMVALTLQAVIKVASHHGSPEQLAAAINELLPARLVVTIVTEGLGVIAAILAIMYVYRVNANQQAKFDIIHGDELGI